MKTDTIQALKLHHVKVTPKTIWSFVELTLAGGTTGWGEATLMRATEALNAPAAAAREALIGGTLAAVDPFIAAQGIAPMPRAAIASALEQAAWDARARQAGCNVLRLLGAPERFSVPLYANMNRRTVERTPAGFFLSAQQTLAAGYTTLKIAPFDDVTPDTDATPEGRRLIEAGLSRVAAVRQASAGRADVQLYVDCHWRFSAPTAASVLRELADLGVVWFECPLPETEANMPALRRLRGQANARGVRLAGLEELTHADAFRPWLEAGCYDVVMPDVKYAGGIGGVLRVAELAAGFNTACAPHNPTGPVCHAASLIACALGPNMEMLEHQFDETPKFWDIVDGDLPRPHAGISRLPQGDGLGVALRQAALAA
ncbi:MAG: mandelate racemase/muconate lactonizing enzyme family protein [Rhodoferax sp.]|nr:mandelate racemase/muconate lactonizing enzyme family protein [Rhodoferax sp.]